VPAGPRAPTAESAAARATNHRMQRAHTHLCRLHRVSPHAVEKWRKGTLGRVRHCRYSASCARQLLLERALRSRTDGAGDRRRCPRDSLSQDVCVALPAQGLIRARAVRASAGALALWTLELHGEPPAELFARLALGAEKAAAQAALVHHSHQLVLPAFPGLLARGLLHLLAQLL